MTRKARKKRNRKILNALKEWSDVSKRQDEVAELLRMTEPESEEGRRLTAQAVSLLIRGGELLTQMRTLASGKQTAGSIQRPQAHGYPTVLDCPF